MSEPTNPDDQRPDDPYGAPSGQPQPGAYGTPPPPASAYPPAPGGQFPPAGSGGYAPQDGFPPPPPVSGYGAVPPVTDPADVGSALGWAWKKFTQNAGALILSHLLWGIGVGIVIGILYAVAIVPSIATSNSSDGAIAIAGGLTIGASILVGIVSMVAAVFAQIGLINGYLTIADGRKASIGDFFKFRNIGQAVLVALIVAVAGGLLSFTWIGTYVVMFFTLYALYFVIDRNAGFTEALRNSAQLAIKFVVPTILLVLITGILGGLGAIACFVGLLVTIPWTQLTLTCMFRRLTGGYVAPAA